MDRLFGVGLTNFVLLWLALGLLTVIAKGLVGYYETDRLDGLRELINNF